MNYFCYQANNRDCGFASLKMLLATISKNRSYLYLKKENKKDNYTIKDIINCAKKHGVKLIAYESESKTLNDLKTPFLALIDNESNHLIVVKKIKRNKVYISDPAIGNYKLDVQSFEKQWSGKFIEVDNNDHIKKIKINKPKVVPYHEDIIRTIISFCSIIVLAVGFYFIKDDTNIGLIIGLLFLFISFELVDNWYLIKIINNFDIRYIPKFFNESKVSSPEDYAAYGTFKSKVFGSRKTIFASFVSSLLLIVILSINDIRNFLVAIILLLIALLDYLLFKNKEVNLIKDIESEESFALKNKKTIINGLMEANLKANKYALRKMLKNSIYTFLSIAFALAMMYLSNTISTNYVVFHFGMYYIISNSFKSIIDFCANSNDYKKSYCNFVERCEL